MTIEAQLSDGRPKLKRKPNGKRPRGRAGGRREEGCFSRARAHDTRAPAQENGPARLRARPHAKRRAKPQLTSGSASHGHSASSCPRSCPWRRISSDADRNRRSRCRRRSFRRRRRSRSCRQERCRSTCPPRLGGGGAGLGGCGERACERGGERGGGDGGSGVHASNLPMESMDSGPAWRGASPISGAFGPAPSSTGPGPEVTHLRSRNRERRSISKPI